MNYDRKCPPLPPRASMLVPWQCVDHQYTAVFVVQATSIYFSFCYFWFPETAGHDDAHCKNQTPNDKPLCLCTLTLQPHKDFPPWAFRQTSSEIIQVGSTSINKADRCLQTSVPLGSWSELCCYKTILNDTYYDSATIEWLVSKWKYVLLFTTEAKLCTNSYTHSPVLNTLQVYVN